MRPDWRAIRCLLPTMMVVNALTTQNSAAKQTSGNPPMGVSTGIAHAPIKDHQSHPITAGGVVDGAPIVFADISKQAGLGNGLLDIFVANGHADPGVDQQDRGTTWAQRPQLFHNLDAVHFREVPPAVGSGLADVITARSAALGDSFNDRRVDVVINNPDSTPSLLRNVVKNENHRITIKLIGGSKSPRDAIGSKVFLTSGGARQRGDVIGGGGYGSSSDQRLHFGLGSSTKIDKLEVFWPSGSKEEFVIPEVDCVVTIIEGKGVTRPS
jgi:enediyne biosynthesis protein E4